MISHEHKCIFIHIPKAAGQSVEHYFLKKLGLDWNSRSPLLLRKNNEPNAGPPTLAHMQAIEYVRYHYISRQLFDEYFKFSFVRNPWSRLVSTYKFLGFHSIISFKTFIDYQLPVLMKGKNWFVSPQYEYLYHNDVLMVDFVGKFEFLQEDFKKVCERLGFNDNVLPHVNKSKEEHWKGTKALIKNPNLIRKISFKNTFLPDYREYYSAALRDKIHQIYEKDINLFEYAF
jgi:hypothetical protein